MIFFKFYPSDYSNLVFVGKDVINVGFYVICVTI